MGYYEDLTLVEQEALVKKVRRYTTRSLTVITPEDLIDFIDDPANIYEGNKLDWNGLLADIWEALSTNDLYASRSAGNLSVGMPLAPRRAAYYRAISRSGGGGLIIVGDVTLTDTGYRRLREGEHVT